MHELLAELSDLEAKAAAVYARCGTAAITEALDLLIHVANEFEHSHSGSWIGYHSCVYYSGMERPPNGAFFDREWGFEQAFSNGTRG